MAIDPTTGVYIFDGTEPDYPMVDTLNLAQNATKDAVASLQNGTGLLRTIPLSSFITLASGVTFRTGYPGVVRRLSDRYEFTFAVTRNAPLTHGFVIGTIASQYRPIAGTEWIVSGQQSGGNVNASAMSGVVQGNTGNVIIHSPNGSAVNVQITGYFYRA